MTACRVCEGEKVIALKSGEKPCPSCHGRGVRPLLIYVAGPYTHDDPVVNTRTAILQGTMIFERGEVALVPHVSMLEHLIRPLPYDAWIERGIRCVEVCDMVVRLPGRSDGADRECARARELGLTVTEMRVPDGAEAKRG